VTATGAAINALKISRRCQLFIRITSKKIGSYFIYQVAADLIQIFIGVVPPRINLTNVKVDLI
jgi:hypothetical protein